ncbi:MAG: hypothetical protein GX409_10120 [candidate division Zixibacteria bacterium]|nr:hypothetical protein [candidate division Zixibacteria bacterium]
MGIRDIFKVPGGEKIPESDKPTPDEQELMDRLAKWVVKKGLTVPAIIALESVKPLNWIGSQAMVFFDPFFSSIFSAKTTLKDYETFQRMMEKRQNVENLLLTIEKFDAEAQKAEMAARKEQKAIRKQRRQERIAKIAFWKKRK